jgi:hypothetical protein
MRNNPVAIIGMTILIGLVAWMVLPSLSGTELPVMDITIVLRVA